VMPCVMTRVCLLMRIDISVLHLVLFGGVLLFLVLLFGALFFGVRALVRADQPVR